MKARNAWNSAWMVAFFFVLVYPTVEKWMEELD